MNRDVPYTDPTNPEYKKWVGYCYHQYKLENAVKHGAAGMLYIDGCNGKPKYLIRSFDYRLWHRTPASC